MARKILTEIGSINHHKDSIIFTLGFPDSDDRFYVREQSKNTLKATLIKKKIHIRINGTLKEFIVKDVTVVSSLAGFMNIFIMLDISVEADAIQVGDSFHIEI